MMIPLVALCAYFSQRYDRTRVPQGWAAFKFIRAIKGDPFRKFAYVPVGNRREYLTNSSKSLVFGWFAEMAIARLARGNIAMPEYVVPLPSSDCTLAEADYDSAPRRLAREFATAEGTVNVCDVLRWKTAPPRAHDGGGSRDPAVLYPMLVQTNRVVGPCALIDDVSTTGGHARAAARLLEENGADVEFVLVAGQTNPDDCDDAFVVPTRRLDRFMG